MVIVPLNSLNLPRTLAPTRWRATKPTVECRGSTTYVPGAGRGWGFHGHESSFTRSDHFNVSD